MRSRGKTAGDHGLEIVQPPRMPPNGRLDQLARNGIPIASSTLPRDARHGRRCEKFGTTLWGPADGGEHTRAAPQDWYGSDSDRIGRGDGGRATLRDDIGRKRRTFSPRHSLLAFEAVPAAPSHRRKYRAPAPLRVTLKSNGKPLILSLTD